LYRKSLEGKEKEQYEKKRKIKEAIREGKTVPTELKYEYNQLKHTIDAEDQITQDPLSHIDDEYAEVGINDPKILITTSRDPSSRLTQFAKEVRLIIPNSSRINRGNEIIKNLISASKANHFTDVIIIHEHRGDPDGLIISHLPYGPTAYFGLSDVVLRHDISRQHAASSSSSSSLTPTQQQSDQQLTHISQQYPHLIFDKFDSKLGLRFKNILKYLFPVPKHDANRTFTFVNRNDTISFRHHTFKKNGREVELSEAGPRFELKPYQIKLGTVDMAEAENEWVLRPFMNTAKKRKAL